ncbi:MAG: hypothetical protein FWE67_05210 [Planctomycetaceae bacterium]|nr:hypothetical protein [Planctomycetaceae bacterium]
MEKSDILQIVALFLTSQSDKEPTKDEICQFLQRHENILSLLEEIKQEDKEQTKGNTLHVRNYRIF